jgi:uncharacterized protein YjiS (DUF1127 family)
MNAFEYTASRWLASTATAGGPAPAAQGIVARIIACIRAILRGMRGGHESRIALRQLQSMSDWQLKDIGMNRSQILYLTGGISAPSTRITHVKN